MRRLSLHLANWIAVFTVLAAVIAPAMGLVHGARAALWTEVCSTDGTRWASLGEDGVGTIGGTGKGDHRPAAGHGLDHCPACSTGTHAFGAPPHEWPAWSAAPTLHRPSQPAASAPRAPQVWRASLPRAPPPTA